MALISLAIAAGMMVAGAPVGSEPLVPSTGWNIDYAQTNCTLSRSYGTGEQAVSLGFIPQTGGTRVKIVLMAKDLTRFVGGRGTAYVAVGEGARTDGDYFSTRDPQLGRIALVTSLRKDLEGLGGARTLSVTLRGETLTFAIPQMAAALKALDGCEVDLAKSWGFDFSLIAVKPVPIHPEKWLSTDDYPKGALFTSTSGITEFNVTIDPKGKPAACLVTQTSGAVDLDARACDVIMTRARFQPGKDKDGAPIQSIWASAIRWMAGGS